MSDIHKVVIGILRDSVYKRLVIVATTTSRLQKHFHCNWPNAAVCFHKNLGSTHRPLCPTKCLQHVQIHVHTPGVRQFVLSKQVYNC